MAQDNISKFAADPEKLAGLLRKWDVEHQRLYARKRDALRELRDNTPDAVEVEPQWPTSSGGCLKGSYLSRLQKVGIG